MSNCSFGSANNSLPTLSFFEMSVRVINHYSPAKNAKARIFFKSKLNFRTGSQGSFPLEAELPISKGKTPH